ncbi:MAG: sn-glycerol-3-phosphate ABC transporter substrate-binding protein UgpB [Roseomonas sp.]|nr:sn-glycerol-3-phosphate ABC transporter substrate-binding protein UgpB [Roseomonas sp.]MCA3306889.1 sn-glycerol-3-phosphate ABC transporter substrate-binding protein UgpB [Roseomonas sp.]MCA3312679.1 sn-glycerol-3-phosphate ABC transporter substrate-binding protein UgpB [Roseomonas sp.]MCA3344461.1 sn-glycerol-3-phosphate ABC transporter substrate-binding protein UgpB [Roseomonas sp.]
MQRRHILLGTSGLLAAPFIAPSVRAQGRTEIQFWYGLGGALGERVAEQVTRFNESQSRFRVNANFRGSYVEVMTGAIAAWRAGTPPHIAQVFEVGTATMMAAGPAIRPTHELLGEAGIDLDPKRYLAGVRGYYSDTQGRLVSMPHNSSSAVLWINLEAFEKAGLSTTDLPKTWAEIRAAAQKIKATNAAEIPISTAWPTWVMFEQMSSIHDVGLATKANGFEGLDATMNLGAPIFAKHTNMLLEMQREGTFVYGGRDADGFASFPAGKAAMSFNSSAGRAQVQRDAKFRWASVVLPYHADVLQSPRNGVIGGASLWTLTARNRTAEEYRGVAEFYRFISEVEQDKWWHHVTGYVPLTLAAYEASRAEGFYTQNPGADAAIIQLSRAEPTPNSQGFRLGGFVEIRNIIQEELERGFQGQQNTETLLANANRRADVVLRNFERANRR